MEAYSVSRIFFAQRLSQIPELLSEKYSIYVPYFVFKPSRPILLYELRLNPAPMGVFEKAARAQSGYELLAQPGVERLAATQGR